MQKNLSVLKIDLSHFRSCNVLQKAWNFWTNARTFGNNRNQCMLGKMRCIHWHPNGLVKRLTEEMLCLQMANLNNCHEIHTAAKLNFVSKIHFSKVSKSFCLFELQLRHFSKHWIFLDKKEATVCTKTKMEIHTDSVYFRQAKISQSVWNNFGSSDLNIFPVAFVVYLLIEKEAYPLLTCKLKGFYVDLKI